MPLLPDFLLCPSVFSFTVGFWEHEIVCSHDSACATVLYYVIISFISRKREGGNVSPAPGSCFGVPCWVYSDIMPLIKCVVVCDSKACLKEFSENSHDVCGPQSLWFSTVCLRPRDM